MTKDTPSGSHAPTGDGAVSGGGTPPPDDTNAMQVDPPELPQEVAEGCHMDVDDDDAMDYFMVLDDEDIVMG